MFVLGTAGHVDHGKSSLVKALTGIDPDRLPEEKARGLTIDLGFAWYTARDDTPIGIVDVPGHERFVRNMIAGVGAVDFVCFVVAADDGWMPQSAEHLDILRFLGVRHGLIAITKIDLVKPDWLELVVEDVKDKMQGTFLEHAPIVPVSPQTGAGMEDLKVAIDQVVETLPRREDIGRPRLYLDRVFTMAGRGSVVTGTLIEGSLAAGQEVMLVPSGVKARIRELQSHKQTVRKVGPGRRVAVNLSGVERSELSRGECLVLPQDRRTYTFVIVHVTLLADTRFSIKTGRRVLALLGTAEPEATCRLLDIEEIEPAGSGVCELRLSHPIKARLGDRFVLRLPTPGVTIGGGRVLDFPAHRVTRSDVDYLEALRRRIDDFSLPVILRTEMARQGWIPISAWALDVSYSAPAIDAEIKKVVAAGEWTPLADGYVDARHADALRARALNVLAQYHKKMPFANGLNESEWREQADAPEGLFKALLILWLEQRAVQVKDGRYHLPEHAPALPASWTVEARTLEKLIVDGGMSPPLRTELETTSEHARAIMNFWFSTGRMVNLPEGVIYPRDVFDGAQAKIRDFCRTNGSITVAQVRDLLGTSRKFVVPLLTYTDELGLTRREGDLRYWVGKG